MESSEGRRAVTAGKTGIWRRARIGDTLRLVNGAAFKPTDWAKDGIPIVRIQNLNNPEAAFNLTKRELPEKFKLRGGELLFAWSGTPGTSFGAHIWRGGEAWLNQHIFNVLFDENEWDKKFLQFAINQNLADYIRAAHGGAGLAHITKGRFEESELLQPKPAEQRRIVAEIEKQFTRLDAGVAALRRVQANLKRYRAAVLKAACEGRLVPTEANLHRQRKTKTAKLETGAELLTRILAERRQNWTDRGRYKAPTAPDTASLPPLPEGWTWASGAQLFTWASGEGLTQKDIQAGDFPVFGGNGVTGYHNAFVAENPTIVIGRVGALCGNVYLTSGRAWITDNAIYATQTPSAVSMKFVEITFRQAGLNKRAAGSGQPFVNQRMLNETVVPLPPLAEQTRIVAEVERRLSVVEELESVVSANLQRATRLRQSILHKAFTGELPR
jgi:type I restriction enzyme S subunit